MTQHIRIIHDVAAEVGGDIYEGYSGRGMFGDQCWAVACDNPVATIEAAASRGLRGGCYDNLGLRYVVYWLAVPYQLQEVPA